MMILSQTTCETKIASLPIRQLLGVPLKACYVLRLHAKRIVNVQTRIDATTGRNETALARPDDRGPTSAMSSSTADVFRSHHEVMEALHQNFAGADDAQKATAIDKLRQDMSMACQMQQDEVKSTIQGQRCH